MKRIAIITAVASIPLVVAACAHKDATSNTSFQPVQDTGAVHSIVLPKYQPNLPLAPNRDLVASACLSCHSSRYITMQPKLSAAKWDEEVRKMVKVYGAPIPDEQVAPIVQYMMATKEAGQVQEWNLRAVVTGAGTIPDVMLATDPAARKADATRGREIYDHACISCHGTFGAGDGRSGAALLPHPNDLTAARYSPRYITASIAVGVPATAMPAFPMIQGDDLRAIVTYVSSLSAIKDTNPAPASAETKSLYAQSCAACHGTDGAADGPIAPVLPRSPANFKLKQPSVASALKAITAGVPGSSMPQWQAKLNAAQTQALADYVRSMYQSPSQ